MRYSNKDIAHMLRSMSAMLELKEANRFRVLAYDNAADSIEHLTQEIYDVWQSGELENIQGIGPSIREHLNEYFTQKKDSYFEKQLSRIPGSVYELMKAPGIGPKKAYKIAIELDLHDPETIFADVIEAAEKGRISEIEGFGEKSEEDIVQSIQMYQEKSGQEERMSLPRALSLSEDIMQYMKKCNQVIRIEALGSLRRHAPTIGDIDLLVTCTEDHMKNIIDYFTDYPNTISVENEGESKASIMVGGGKRIDLRLVRPDQYGSMVQYFTGNKQHNVKLREHAQKKNLKISEYGITEKKSDTLHTFENEEGFYRYLKMDWIPPEIRQGDDEIPAALKNELPKLVEPDDIQGEFHVHSNFDLTPSHDLGEDSFKVMAGKAHEMGYTYLAFSEHNPARSKLSDDDITELLRKKKEKIQSLSSPVRLFNSLEIDISPDGTLALPDSAFKHLDLAIISIHSSFRMSKKEMTDRILKAMNQNPKVRILGHPTGRMLGKREEIEADWQKIFDEAKKRNIALEINAWPDRLDLPDALVRKAIGNGNMCVINTDSHAVDQMEGVRYGVFVARRGWAEKSDIMNTKPVTKIEKWLSV